MKRSVKSGKCRCRERSVYCPQHKVYTGIIVRVTPTVEENYGGHQRCGGGHRILRKPIGGV